MRRILPLIILAAAGCHHDSDVVTYDRRHDYDRRYDTTTTTTESRPYDRARYDDRAADRAERDRYYSRDTSRYSRDYRDYRPMDHDMSSQQDVDPCTRK
jgi:hypothetical protein